MMLSVIPREMSEPTPQLPLQGDLFNNYLLCYNDFQVKFHLKNVFCRLNGPESLGRLNEIIYVNKDCTVLSNCELLLPVSFQSPNPSLSPFSRSSCSYVAMSQIRILYINKEIGIFYIEKSLPKFGI